MRFERRGRTSVIGDEATKDGVRTIVRQLRHAAFPRSTLRGAARDWRWRTRAAWDVQSMTMQMFNVAPDAKEYAAVEANYRRAGGGR